MKDYVKATDNLTGDVALWCIQKSEYKIGLVMYENILPSHWAPERISKHQLEYYIKQLSSFTWQEYETMEKLMEDNVEFFL